MGFDLVAVGLQGAAAIHEHHLEVLQVGEGAIGDGFIDQGPQRDLVRRLQRPGKAALHPVGVT